MTALILSPKSSAPSTQVSLHEKPKVSLRGTTLLAVMSSAMLVGVFGLWAGFTLINGAVVAQGQIITQAQAQQIQSLDGGTVTAIMVKNGDHVQAGQVMVRFDPTLTRTNLDIAMTKLADALTLQSRLQAEQQNLPAPDFTPSHLPFPAPDLTEQAQAQTRVFAARAAVLQGQRDRLEETLAQYDSQLKGLALQIGAKEEQISLTDALIADQESLLAKGLTRQTTLSDMRSARAELLGSLAALQADEARLANAKTDSRLETLQGERSFQEKVSTELSETSAKVQELSLEIITRREQLTQMELRAPMDGVVHEVKVATVGGVVAPGATVLAVIPQGGDFDFEVQVDPRGIDQVHQGQTAELALTSFDPRSTPRLHAEVTGISPDAVVDPHTGRNFYRVMLSVPPAELDRLKGQEILPGMPVTAYLATSSRSVLAYLVQPMAAQIDMAFRED
ncbi:MAG: HlyD family type I secretion periplasmic adaptor subunit [Candidatus Saccharibacteria bacterium]|nr:HlyD family type I secretion periplasmic adaptor subunit [Pseudorhodobacter sp.]